MNVDKPTLFEGCRIVRYSAWRPDALETGPDVSFTDSRFRRRLSMISRMTVRVVHDLMPFDMNAKLYFTSFRGELNQQFKINKMLIEDGEILPAAFSLSVFNAPPALAAMALGLEGGYSAVYPGGDNFAGALRGAAAALKAAIVGTAAVESSAGKQLVFVYADETPVEEYKALEHGAHSDSQSLAFAFILSAGPQHKDCIPLDRFSSVDCETPERFLAAMRTLKVKSAGLTEAAHV